MTLSTHVLDTRHGRPAPGIPVRLEREHDGGWAPVGAGTTDADGRIGGWETPLAGTHRLVFTVDTAFYPEVVVVFRIAEPTASHHIPLLLSPYGYTTYRGS